MEAGRGEPGDNGERAGPDGGGAELVPSTGSGCKLGGPRGDGWITATEARKILGLAKSTAQRLCREGKYGATKSPGSDGAAIWLLRGELVEVEAARRQKARADKEAGRKRCPTCGEKKDAKGFWKSQGECIECQKARRKSPYREAGQRPDYGVGERLSGDVAEYVEMGPPSPESSLKYACMDFGFAHRPLPMANGKRMSKREAFCQQCTATRCVHHPELTPKELVRRWKLSERWNAAGMS